MIRQIIHIDEEKCNGCGLCARACHEGALAIVNGKAKLLRDDYCDGMGDCLPGCPAGALSFENREADPYDQAAVEENKKKKAVPTLAAEPSAFAGAQPSRLANWPVQIKLAPITAPWLDGAKLLIAADCTAFSYGGFHEEFLKGRVCLVGCSKLDGTDYSEKLAAIFKRNAIEEILLVRMEVPCCGGLVNMTRKAIEASGKSIPLRIETISTDGRLL